MIGVAENVEAISPRLGLHVLGSVELTIDGAPQSLGGTKPRAVLAMLLIRRGRVVAADALAAAAWNDDPPPDYRASLHVIVSKLRKALGGADVDPKTVLATVAPGYRLSVADDDFDLARFRALSSTGGRLAEAGQFEEASAALSHALDEWKGPVLDDLRGHSFADAFAATLEEELLATASARTQAEIACGRAESVISTLIDLTNEHPLREPLWAQLITALYLAGRQSDALDTCRRLRTTLADELGIDPSGPLQDLEKRILNQEPLTVTTGAMTLTLIEQQQRVATGQLRDRAGTAIPVPPAGLRIGRKNTNDLVLSHRNVSRYHAIVVATGPQYEIRDLQSSNGTLINGERIIDSAVLGHGDVIRIGSTEWSFEVIGP
ncbi:FHA domain-containing protein [Rhodococcus sp. USK10]|uniref:BTAD domain-containing putative transcriptional regulator n=1 Tax=Rhodococcus sp. USK10 TaxID=2789739 RepID=UPI001C5F17EE|nr:FHA domain-containing protein [Rhodococcus sp. USK10]